MIYVMHAFKNAKILHSNIIKGRRRINVWLTLEQR